MVVSALYIGPKCFVVVFVMRAWGFFCEQNRVYEYEHGKMSVF